MKKEPPMLEIHDLQKYFRQNTGLLRSLFREDPDEIQAVDGVSLTLSENEVKGIIGESGCGKSTLLKTLVGLYEPTAGTISFNGETIAESGNKINLKEYQQNVQLIFQDPFNSLNPKMSVREILSEPLNIHNLGNQSERIMTWLNRVELNPPEKYLDQKPNQLSGGEKQRVSIARALIVDPDIILADEPVSMLDVSTQAAILELLSDLIEEEGVSMLYISHDLSTLSYICEEINVMYLGRLVETANVDDLLKNPKHPYTKELINAIPIPDPHHNRRRTEMDGAPRDPINLGEGCRFRDRCPERMDICERTPETIKIDEDHQTACHLYYDHEEYTEQESDSAEESNRGEMK